MESSGQRDADIDTIAGNMLPRGDITKTTSEPGGFSSVLIGCSEAFDFGELLIGLFYDATDGLSEKISHLQEQCGLCPRQ